MFRKTRIILPALLAGVVAFQACKDKDKLNDEFRTADSGLQYKLYAKNEEGNYVPKESAAAADTTKGAKVGDFILMEMKYQNSEDSVLFDSFKDNEMPVILQVMEPTFIGGLEDAFRLLEAGDSAVFKISADSLFNKTFMQPMPPFIKPGSQLTFFVRADKIMTREQAMEEQQRIMMEQQKGMMERAEKQKVVDEETIQNYLKEQNMTDMQKTENGVYYKITKKGTGAQPQPGDVVSVKYTGKLLNGQVFDSSDKQGGQPFQFVLGRGQVIPGWDEAIAKLSKGAQATLVIPSTMAYGERAMGTDIPANSVLLFDVELVDIQKAGNQ
ncbi:MAG: FKBP-type peptidyl-prolyl cis-trans isomerase [Hymenobacteraceae bacterium]|nr:FKBP-type peptidyl-prolyl cis-trans isomerase [Hymenobacteraceae bacterium]MDX5395617.1 FKBP-type peptidyl-prolyl cis-trans isomerase [Hymenobacteraceae bacterium]MDX5511671.1 FKBP-type peptidyl-prolyl cis-trans isomerase [Hymenobacteraceae bacterium]